MHPHPDGAVAGDRFKEKEGRYVILSLMEFLEQALAMQGVRGVIISTKTELQNLQ